MTTTSPAPRIALITGGGRGLGRATALALAAAGVDPIVTYVQGADRADEVVAEARALGRRAAALRLDAADTGSFAAFADALRATLRDEFDGAAAVDVLVNNAGTAHYGAFADTTEEQFDAVFAVHVKGVFFLTQALLPLLADGGQIVTLGSGLTRLTMPGSGTYAAAKGAIDVLTRYLALELAGRGITANVVAPGAVPTDFGDGHLREDPALQELVVGQTALGRLATADDIGAAIAGLVTASGRWITGQRIEASGGLRL
ncbi:SDR family oxidoreductase [Patulibacter sp. SYSU D01012]|uniref:SDR family NAD(P)-dependent oxidoreductase n=1 Tax=Patulibacter sp. SYSU D01012 TaxID=2817381 RepID=UPI001B310577|nr:SDR family oxidoreductase [Patulibacter sp. SYSU D01012]